MFPTFLWWMIGLRGVLAIAFGVAAICWPIRAVAVLVMICGAYLAADGCVILAGQIFAKKGRPPFVIQGCVYILFGVAALVWPEVATVSLLIVAGILALAAGILEISHAIARRQIGENAGWSFLGGIVAIGFGIVMLASPLLGTIAVGLLLGIYALAYGFALLITAQNFRRSLRGQKQVADLSPRPPLEVTNAKSPVAS